ncbi:lipoyltransferase 1, mitochondrial [Chrysoperla carnea]|uniref:lipoyltransferase 1, mitochondrial n=1 Tax=Chrysoperla carnea TaxID=189513 RepID=UPI001D0880AC|nr:lipoyltransferase 1, mitochondrial [Chrysoperla carnea]
MFFKRATSLTILTTCGKNMTLVRRLSDDALKKSKPAANEIKKSVFISQSTDVFTNLALEQWMFKNMDFTHKHILMLWRNDPCVVIGRHQNPWIETNVDELKNQGVKIARRNSGGGTVYHDLGNLNMTFFTPQKFYNRRYNLEIISRALFREWGLDAKVNKREDIVVRDSKISGTASKLTRTNCYHHCTLLVDVNKSALGNALLKKDLGIESNATKSIPSPVLNLKDENRHVNMNKLMTAVGWEYLRTPATELIDNGMKYASQQNGFKYINPTEGWFPELNNIREEFASWDWTFGKTPKFTSNIYLPTVHDEKIKIKLSMIIEGGKIQDIVLQIPPGLSTMGFEGEARVYIAELSSLKGQPFSQNAVDLLRKMMPYQESKDLGKVLVESVN